MSAQLIGEAFEWSFSFTDGTHRLSHERQPAFEADLTSSTAAFDKIFSDSLASISGGWPDTAGTITITCDGTP